MGHPETWNILPGESNWEEGDPYSICLEHEGESYCILFVMPILRDLFTGYDLDEFCDEEEEQAFSVLRGLREYIVTGCEVCSALTYYLVHELMHWGTE